MIGKVTQESADAAEAVATAFEKEFTPIFVKHTMRGVIGKDGCRATDGMDGIINVLSGALARVVALWLTTLPEETRADAALYVGDETRKFIISTSLEEVAEAFELLNAKPSTTSHTEH